MMRLRKCLSLAVLAGLVLFGSPALGQLAGAEVELPVDWSVGESHRVEMIKQRIKVDPSGKRTTAESRSIVAIRVLERREPGYLVRWTYERVELPGSDFQEHPFIGRIARLAEQSRLDLQLDELGSVIGLANVEEVMAHYRTAIGTIVDGFDKPDLKRLFLQMTAGLDNPTTVAALSIKEPQLFYLAFGGRHTDGEPWAFNDLLPNPLGGPPFPTQATMTLREVRPAENLAVIDWHQVIDRDRGREALIRTVEIMLRRSNITAPPEGALEEMISTLDIEDNGENLFDMRTGWPQRIVWQRETRVGTVSQIERLRFRTLPDAP